MDNQKVSSYTSIFKSTFLFGFVQVFNIIAKVGINKAVAIFLGADGMGIISLYQSTINILKTAFELGISQSAVRDLSQSMHGPRNEYSRTITVVKKIILFSSLLGGLTTFVLSSYLSRWTFNGSSEYVYSFMWLSLVVFLNILSEGQLGILKGMRHLKALAKASLLGSFVGLFIGTPLYYFFSYGGIIPSLLTTALASVLFSYYYVSKIEYNKDSISIRNAVIEGMPMVKMGVALMYVAFLGVLSDYFIRIYISSKDSLYIVGLFQAGSMIITSYFGIVISSLTTDYYPRISAINFDNEKLENEFNKQCEVGLLIILPLVVFFIFAQKFFVYFLYSSEFLSILDYLEFASFGVIMLICSNSLGIILLAKQATKTFFLTATIGRIVIVLISLFMFNYWGLKGLGIAYFASSIFHLLFMQFVLFKKYQIKMSESLILMIFVALVFSLFSLICSQISNMYIKYSSGAFLMISVLFYTFNRMKVVMGIDICKILKQWL